MKIFVVAKKIKYVQFYNIKFKMSESQILIGLATSFKNWQKEQNVYIYSILNVYIYMVLPPPPPTYGLYACENVDNYGLPLINTNKVGHCLYDIYHTFSSPFIIKYLTKQITIFTQV